MLISSSSPLVPLNGISQFTSSLSSLLCEEASIGPRQHSRAHADVFRVSFKVFKPKDTLLLVTWSAVTFCSLHSTHLFSGEQWAAGDQIQMFISAFGLTQDICFWLCTHRNGPQCTRSEPGDLLALWDTSLKQKFREECQKLFSKMASLRTPLHKICHKSLTVIPAVAQCANNPRSN